MMGRIDNMDGKDWKLGRISRFGEDFDDGDG